MYYKTKTPEMRKGKECDLVVLILEQVKAARGLTTILDKQAGINGKWLKPDKPYNISVELFLRVIIYKAHFQIHDEFEIDNERIIDWIYTYINQNKTWPSTPKHIRK